MKKFMALMLALAMVLALVLISFAASNNTADGSSDSDWPEPLPREKRDPIAKEDLKIGIILVHDENSGYDVAHIDGITNIDFPFAHDAALDGDAFLGHQNALCGIDSGSGSGGSSGGGSSRSGFGSGSFGTANALQGRNVFTGVAHGADIDQTGNFVAFFEELLQQGTGSGGDALELSLVSLISKQDIAHVDSIANIDLPLAHDTGFNSDAFLGHQNALCHLLIHSL